MQGQGVPQHIQNWFLTRGWHPHPHQLEMVRAAQDGASALLIAPTGGGKTLAGFLPSLIDLYQQTEERKHTPARTHTLYVSPLKALTADIGRNLQSPIDELGLEISLGVRSGDTPTKERKQQQLNPPDIFLTTPESLALLLSYGDSFERFAHLQCIIIDELHALVHSKRGQLLALALARLQKIAPQLRCVGLSATVHDPAYLQRWLGKETRLVLGKPGQDPSIEIQLPSRERMPWSGHMALRSMPDVLEHIAKAKTAIVFVNTRAQAELTFQALWKENADGLAIGLHHGSLEKDQRLKVEDAMAKGLLQGVVATSSLDLGIDWGAVDLVIQVGAPKGVARLLQRIGRSNHQFNRASSAVLVPGNRFEVLECQAAVDGIKEATIDGEPRRDGGLDVLAQHLIGMACAKPFTVEDMYAEVCSTDPYQNLSFEDFCDVLEFVSDGGYALKAYERFKKIKQGLDPENPQAYAITNHRLARTYRMNLGTIIEETNLKVRLGSRPLGEVEEYFAQMLVAGDTFVFAGQVLEFIEIRDMSVRCRKPTSSRAPQVPSYMGSRFPMTTFLAERVRNMLADPASVPDLPEPVQEWIEAQKTHSQLPDADSLLVETFPRAERYHLVAYTFIGKLANQTLGMLLTKRMERLGYGPLGFVSSDYVVAVWSVREVEDMDALFDQDMLGDDMEAWLDESSMLRRTFRNCAMISGLIEKRLPGKEKNRRQITFNTDLIYNTLRSHQPDHVLLRATRRDADTGLLDIDRLAEHLIAMQGKIIHKRLTQVSPLAVPVLLEINRETVYGDAIDELLAEGAADLIDEAESMVGQGL